MKQTITIDQKVTINIEMSIAEWQAFKESNAAAELEVYVVSHQQYSKALTVD